MSTILAVVPLMRSRIAVALTAMAYRTPLAAHLGKTSPYPGNHLTSLRHVALLAVYRTVGILPSDLTQLPLPITCPAIYPALPTHSFTTPFAIRTLVRASATSTHDLIISLDFTVMRRRPVHRPTTRKEDEPASVVWFSITNLMDRTL